MVSELLRAARYEKTAIAAFNCSAFDSMAGVAMAAKESGVPVIIQTSAALVATLGTALPKGWFDLVKKHICSDCYLHLDHCQDLVLLKNCIDAGWDMVMYDGSADKIEDNCRNITAVIAYAHKNNVAVEGEVGGVMGEESGSKSSNAYASARDVSMLAQCGPDCLAIGFGNVHGSYKTKETLNWDVLVQAGKTTELPLVLHGGSGLTDTEFFKAIDAGCAKINISTELKRVYAKAVKNSTTSMEVVIQPLKLHSELMQLTMETALNFITIFRGRKNANGKF
ncbi:class II fructose-bisphosphate aldolase [Oxalobacter sp. OttesenSCG-928-P03]|nr:class II fructose-bisphosphate aldolase [Oxalobacter sp. OttesenSCG-928-P03]